MTGPTTAELTTVLALVRALDAQLVNVGHARDPESAAGADRFVRAWTEAGGQVGVVVSWPRAAASWLRPACRLASGAPDAWVLASGPADWPGLGARLAATGGWRPARTIAFAGLAGLPPTDDLFGLTGARADGSVWSMAIPQPVRSIR